MEEEKISVLYVDDEKTNLNMFKANFRSDFDIMLANSGFEALEILKDQTVHVIIADQKMPGMTGVELFENITDKCKDSVRILLTGYTDVDAAVDSINKGKVFRYIKKPWDDQEIRMSIRNAYEVYNTRQKLYLKNKELQKINEELNRFVYSASHDLKAPILSIKGLLSVATLDENLKDSEKYFGLISKSIKQLEVYIQSIISYYKNVRIENQSCYIDFAKIINEILESFYSYYYSNEIHYKIEIDKDEKFSSDEFRIRVILNNILSNAIKYQKPQESNKQVHVSVKIANKEALLVIEDNGIGINQAYLKDIYKMFFRATTQNSGSGIGLYIVKEAIDKIDGTIEVQSEEDKGTKFTIRIPSKE